MSCGCNDNGMINSWIDWAKTPPQNPQDIIANATLQATQGIYVNSSTFATPSGAGTAATPISLASAPTVVALGTDNLLNVTNAADWMFSHLTANTSTDLARPLQKVIFLRGGVGWKNEINLDFGASTYTDVQLSFRDNAGTRGDMTGTIPAISFIGSFTDVQKLSLTLKTTGVAVMGIRLIHSGGAYSMYESEWIIVA
jgi:hypothetical protein